MTFIKKYLKYKNKYLQLKKQLGGYDSETQLIKEFVDENYQKLITFPDYSIDEKRKEEYIMKHLDEDLQYIIRKLVNKIKYVSIEEFNYKIKEICDIYNLLKNTNDSYIIIIPPQIVSGLDVNIFRKSNFYVTLLTTKYLNYDHILDLSKINENEFIDKINKLTNITDKKIHLFIADDCSYSGLQIKNFINKFSSTYDLSNFKLCIIIPFFLNEEIFKELIDKYKIPKEIIDCIHKNNLDVVNIYDLYESEDIKQRLQILSEKYEISKNIIKSPQYFFGDNYLLYFNFRTADFLSANQIILAGKLIDKLGKINKSNTIFNNDDESYYPFIKNCNNIKFWRFSEYPECPYKLYDKIEYTFKGNKINLHTLDTNLIEKLN